MPKIGKINTLSSISTHAWKLFFPLSHLLNCITGTFSNVLQVIFFLNKSIVDANFGFLPKPSKEYKSYLHQFPELHFPFTLAELTNE